VPGLSCEFGVCQQPCRTDSDCPDAQRCVTGVVLDDAGTAGHVCQLEQNTACQFAVDCLGKQVCGAGECRDTCAVASDCTSGQVCSDNRVCASRDPAKDNVDSAGNLVS
jgi:hypothetical protein